MKKNQLIIIICVFMAFISCTKYDDPGFSVFTVKTRLKGVWLIENTIIDGADSTNHFRDNYGHCNIIIDSDDSYSSFSIQSCPLDTPIINGSWFLSEKSKNLSISLDYGLIINESDRADFIIQKLSYRKKLWMKSSINGRAVEFRLKWLKQVS